MLQVAIAALHVDEPQDWRQLAGPLTASAELLRTADGRVVILSGDVLAVWRPGEPRLAVRRVKRPTQPAIQFLIW